VVVVGVVAAMVGRSGRTAGATLASPEVALAWSWPAVTAAGGGGRR